MWRIGPKQKHLDGTLGQMQVCEWQSAQERPRCWQEHSTERTEQWKRPLSQREGTVGGMERKQSFHDHDDAAKIPLFVYVQKDVVG